MASHVIIRFCARLRDLDLAAYAPCEFPHQRLTFRKYTIHPIWIQTSSLRLPTFPIPSRPKSCRRPRFALSHLGITADLLENKSSYISNVLPRTAHKCPKNRLAIGAESSAVQARFCQAYKSALQCSSASDSKNGAESHASRTPAVLRSIPRSHHPKSPSCSNDRVTLDPSCTNLTSYFCNQT